MLSHEARRRAMIAAGVALASMASCFYDWEAYQAPGGTAGSGGSGQGGSTASSGSGGEHTGDGGSSTSSSSSGSGAGGDCLSCLSWAINCLDSNDCSTLNACNTAVSDAILQLSTCVCSNCNLDCVNLCDGVGGGQPSCTACVGGLIGGEGQACWEKYDTCVSN